MKEYRKRQSCASCNNTSLKTIFFLGNLPLAGNFPLFEELDSVKTYDLSLQFCDNCKLVQTDSIIDSDTLFKDYRYMSSIGLTNHFTNVSKAYKDRFKLNSSHKILEIGSNDGVLLKPFMDLGLDVIGVEPATNISKIAMEKGCKVINDYFSDTNAEHYFKQNSFDLIIANNCFAHIDDIQSVVRGVKYCIKNGGHFIIEIHYLKNLVKELQYDFIYHEHLYYYSLTSLNNLFNKFGMSIVDFEEIDIHSGSIRVYIKNELNLKYKKIEERLKLEQEQGLTDTIGFNNFVNRIQNHITSFKDKISALKKHGYSIVGYGASGRGNTLLNMCNINSRDIDYIVDESPERSGRYIPKMNIPIVKLDYMKKNKPTHVIIFAWNYFNSIKNKIENLDLGQIQYISPFENHE